MIIIDGRLGEGGGQILRTSVGLSAFTGKAVKIINIRQGRCTPGLAEQHLQSVKAVAKLCDAEIKGAKLRSLELEFKPKKIKYSSLNININTAGSVGLVLQALLIPALKIDLKIRINGGGTYGRWAAPTDNFKYVLLPLLKKMGYETKIEVEREGFFPLGGARVNVYSGKAHLKAINLIKKGEIISIKGRSVASEHLKKFQVAERQAKAAKKVLFDHFKMDVQISREYTRSLCPGSGIQLWIKTKNTIIGSNALGEKGKKSEDVGREAALDLIEDYNSGCVDRYTADQLIPYFAIANGGSMIVPKISGHITTNAMIVEQFLPVRFIIKRNKVSCLNI